MAISKRLRFEILRRDKFRCHYCAAAAAEGRELTVDHVVPLALGGTDDPSNLVAACADCNAGKSSVPPDSAMIDEAGSRAVEWREAVLAVSRELQDDHDRLADLVQTVRSEWLNHYRYVDADLDSAVYQFDRAMLPLGEILDAVRITGAREPDEPLAYFCKVCWNKIGELHDRAAERVLSDAPLPASQPPETDVIGQAVDDLNDGLLPEGWKALRDEFESDGDMRAHINIQRADGKWVASCWPIDEPSAPWEAFLDLRLGAVHGDLKHIAGRIVVFGAHLDDPNRRPPYWPIEEDSAFDREWLIAQRDRRAAEIRETYLELVPDATSDEIAWVVRAELGSGAY